MRRRDRGRAFSVADLMFTTGAPLIKDGILIFETRRTHAPLVVYSNKLYSSRTLAARSKVGALPFLQRPLIVS